MKKFSTPYPMLRSVLLSQIAWLASALILITFFSVITLSMDDPDSVIVPLSLCALYLSSAVGGIFAVRLSGDGVLSGALSGMISAGIVFCMSALPLYDSPFSLPTSLIPLSLIVVSSVIGSVIGHKRAKNPSKNRLRNKRLYG